MDIIVAGGTGFLGRPLCAALAEAGHTLTILSRHASSARGSVPAQIQLIAWDPAYPRPDQEWVQRIGRADAVINLAGQNVGGAGPIPTRWTPRFKTALRASRMEATHAIVQALAVNTRRPGVLVNASAVGYYGSRGDEVLTESSEPGVDFFGRLCVEWECSARKAESLGLRVVCLRTGVVLERGAMAAELLVLASRLGAGGRLGSGQQWWSWIHRDDVIGLVQHALAVDVVDGALNVVAPRPRRMIDFPRVLGRLLHRPSLAPAPACALRLAFGEMADALLLASQRVLPVQARETGYTFRYPDVEAALAAIL
jgi:hypothetical protein